MIDYHTHSYRCGHASGTVEEYVDRAVELGLKEIGLSDHFFFYFLPREKRDPRWAMAEADFPAHYDEMCEVRGSMRDTINVRVGVEVDYVPGHGEDLSRALAPYEFDYILGGIHFLDGWMIDDAAEAERFDGADLVDIYRRYYQSMQQGVRERAFDVVAHFDLPKKFGSTAPEATRGIVAETLDCIRDHGVAIEVSTAGLRKPVREMYPAVDVLREIRARHIPIVLSSDAHDPSEVGHAFDQALELLMDLEFLHLASFEQRRSRPIPIRR